MKRLLLTLRTACFYLRSYTQRGHFRFPLRFFFFLHSSLCDAVYTLLSVRPAPPPVTVRKFGKGYIFYRSLLSIFTEARTQVNFRLRHLSSCNLLAETSSFFSLRRYSIMLSFGATENIFTGIQSQ